jgi:hypothetical protein
MTFVKLLIWITAFSGYFFIIATHFHYSVDVFVGFTLTLLVWKLYHHYIKEAMYRDNPYNKMIAWLEDLSEDLHPELFKPIKSRKKSRRKISVRN